MSDYINKNGLSIGASNKELFEELMRGTGFIMGPNASLFIESAGLHDKKIVVSRIVNSGNLAETKKFSVNQFQEAVDCFNNRKGKPGV